MEKIIGRGIRKLEELRDAILKKFGFKRIWLEKHGLKLQLWGEFNSQWMLLETDVENDRFTPMSGAEQHALTSPGNREIIGGRHGNRVAVSNAYSERFNRMSSEAREESLRILRSEEYAARRQRGYGVPDRILQYMPVMWMMQILMMWRNMQASRMLIDRHGTE
jgi:hypothetical protein